MPEQGPFSSPRVFWSAKRTGTGSEETFTHTLGGTPRVVIAVVCKLPALAAILTTAATLWVPGTSTSTNILITVLLGCDYYVLAFP